MMTQNDPISALSSMHEYTKARYGKMSEARNMLDKVRREMDKLLRLGDMVTPEDVTKAAGNLVGHGLSAPAVAQLISDMPTQGGETLQAWIAKHDEDVTKRGAVVRPVHEVARHEMGLSALRLLCGQY